MSILAAALLVATQSGAPTHAVEVEAGSGPHEVSVLLRQSRTRGGRIVSPFTHDGTGRLTLPGDWTPAATTAGMDDGPFREDRVRLVRDSLDASWRGRFDAWRLEAGLDVQRRRGTAIGAGTFGHTGGNARAALVPLPIDDETREWRASATWLGARHAFRADLLLGAYENAFRAVEWRNPFAQVTGWGPGAAHPDGIGVLAQAPDNRARDLSVGWAWREPGGLQLNLDHAVGRHEQDDPFAPYTLNPEIAVFPLPRASLDGAVERRRTQARVRYPVSDRLDVEARWRDERHDDRTAPALFIYPAGDTVTPGGAASPYARWRLPHDQRRTRTDAAFHWRIARRDRVRFEWGHEDSARAYSEVAETEERRLALEWRRTGVRAAHLRVERETRDAGAYRHDLPWLAYHTDAYVATVAPELRWENHPLLRRFNLADRTRDAARGGWSWSGDAWSVGALAHVRHDRYSESVFGLTEGRQHGATADIGYAVSDTQHVTVWASRERWESRQDGRHFRGGAFAATDWLDANRDWRAVMDDRADGFGAAWRHRAPWRGGTLGVDLARTRSGVDVDVTAGPDIPTAPLPRVTTRVDRVTLSLAQDLTPRTTMRFALDHERWRGSDWATDGVDATTVASVLGFVEPLPRRNLGWASVAVEIRL